MKITKKRLLLSISIVATALVTGGVVYAFSSSSFLTKAQNYVSSQCNSALISSKNTVANNQKATVCYNYYKNIEQDTNITNIKSSNDSLSSSIPYLLDGNGTVLGKLIGGGTPMNSLISFYDSTLNKVIEFNPSNGAIADTTSPYYISNNCSGTIYSLDASFSTALYLLNGFPQISYATTVSSISSVQHLRSQYVSGVCHQGNWDNGSGNGSTVFTMTQVTPDISFPIALPITIK